MAKPYMIWAAWDLWDNILGSVSDLLCTARMVDRDTMIRTTDFVARVYVATLQWRFQCATIILKTGGQNWYSIVNDVFARFANNHGRLECLYLWSKFTTWPRTSVITTCCEDTDDHSGWRIAYKAVVYVNKREKGYWPGDKTKVVKRKRSDGSGRVHPLITPMQCQRYRHIDSRTCVKVDSASYGVLKSAVHPMATFSASIFSNTPSLDTHGDALNMP